MMPAPKPTPPYGHLSITQKLPGFIQVLGSGGKLCPINQMMENFYASPESFKARFSIFLASQKPSQLRNPANCLTATWHGSSVDKELLMSLFLHLEDYHILISPASYWEIAIKVSLSKYQIPGSFQVWMKQQILVNAFQILSITIAHAATVSTLPFHHRDPLDCLLIAQSLTEKIAIISANRVFDSYFALREW
jgi:PIN domain nuclease of toxin-antitoxin system